MNLHVHDSASSISCGICGPVFHLSLGNLVAWIQVKAQTEFAYDYTFLDGDDDSAGCFDKKSSVRSAC